jgi:BirA family biotin operon repressor/biotin-[acetyl-CoA-carboxylase] ligase
MPEKLDTNRIQHALGDKCSVNLFESLDSTNEWVLQKIREGESIPFACFAEQQTQGRGRRGKHWVSPPLCNIYMSLGWMFELPVSQIGVLSLAIGMAVVKALEKTGIQNAMLKWPNDVLVDDKKIAGILIETARINDKNTSVCIGVGLNYHLSDTLLPGGLSEVPDQLWTDVVTSLNHQPESGRNQLATLLLQECVAMCERMPQEQEKLIKEFQDQYDACAQKAVSVMLDNGVQLQGIACGVTPTGEIRILIDGEERVFNSAEISLRKQDQEKESEKVYSC